MDALLGWTRLEIVNKVLDSLGRSNDGLLKSRLNEDINMAQLAFWKFHDWTFAYKQLNFVDNFRFVLVNAQFEYVLTTLQCNFEARTSDIDKIYLISNNNTYDRVLTKITSREYRTMDIGSHTGPPEFWAPVSHNKIQFWPVPDAAVVAQNTMAYMDGKVMPTFLSADGQYSSIPIEYQESFIQYLLVRALSRERDPRQVEEANIFQSMLRRDIEHNLRDTESNLRMKWAEEEFLPDYGRTDLLSKIWNA